SCRARATDSASSSTTRRSARRQETPGGAGGKVAVVRSNLLASRATSLGRLRPAPHPPRRGSLAAPPAAGTARGAEAPCASGRATARRIRSRRQPSPRPHPAARVGDVFRPELRFGEGADVFGEAVEEGEVLAEVAHARFEHDVAHADIGVARDLVGDESRRPDEVGRTFPWRLVADSIARANREDQIGAEATQRLALLED